MTITAPFVPYQEGPDAFVQEVGKLTGRLHLQPETGHARFEPLPSNEALTEFYNGLYTRPNHSSVEAELSPAVVEVARGLIAHMQDLAGLGKTFTTHDVGCAFGALTYGLQAHGITASGNEASREMVAAGNKFCKGTLSHKPLAEALADLKYQLDLVTALHVLEHLPDPFDAIRTIAKKLSPNGVLYICVPNGHSLQAMLGGRRRDPCYNFPGHLQYFTPKSLVAMARAAGLEPISLNTRALPHMEGGIPGVEALIGAPAAKMPDPASWSAAVCANLLGYELFLLAGLPGNTKAKREPGIIERAEKAYQTFRHVSRFEANPARWC